MPIEQLLPEIERRATERRRVKVVAILAAAAAVLVVLGLVFGPGLTDRKSVPPVEKTNAVPQPPLQTSYLCNTSYFGCRDGEPVEAAMGAQVQWDLPETFYDGLGQVSFFVGGPADDEVLVLDLFRGDTNDDEYAGISLVQSVRAADTHRTGRVDRNVDPTAEGLANWLAQRPDLISSPVTRGNRRRPSLVDRPGQRQEAGQCFRRHLQRHVRVHADRQRRRWWRAIDPGHLRGTDQSLHLRRGAGRRRRRHLVLGTPRRAAARRESGSDRQHRVLRARLTGQV